MRYAALLVAGLTALFVALRAPGLDTRLPHAPEPDGKLVHQAVDPPQRGKYPFLWVAALAATGAVEPADLAPDAPLEARLDDARRPFRAGRLLVLLVSAAAVPATYLLGRRLSSPRVALLAAALTAVGPIWTLYAVQARPHALAASTSLWAVLACAAAVRRATATRHLGAALAVGFAASTFHTGLLVGPTYLATLAVSRPRGRALAAAATGVVLATLLAAWSYAPEPDADLTPGLSRTAKRFGAAAVERDEAPLRVSGHAVYPGLFDGGGVRVLGDLLRSNDPVLLVLAPLGLVAVGVASLRRGPARTGPPATERPDAPTPSAGPGERFVVAGHPLVLLGVLGLYSGSAERFFLPLVPYLALLAARAVDPLLARRPPWPALAATAVLALPTATTARLSWLRAQPDASERMAAWIAANLDPDAGTILLTGGEELPLLRRDVPPDRPGRRSVSWLNRQSDHPAPAAGVVTWPLVEPDVRYPRRMLRADAPERLALELLDEVRPRFVLLAPWGVRSERASDPTLEVALWRAVHERGARLLARFDPVGPGASGPRGLDSYLGRDAVRALWCVDFLGPRLDLWELTDPAPEGAR